jgi:hypothetical protein
MIKIMHTFIDCDIDSDDIWSDELLEVNINEDCNHVSCYERAAGMCAGKYMRLIQVQLGKIHVCTRFDISLGKKLSF